MGKEIDKYCVKHVLWKVEMEIRWKFLKCGTVSNEEEFLTIVNENGKLILCEGILKANAYRIGYRRVK